MQASEPEDTTATRLLEVAARQFQEKGYAATTTRELAALLGVQHASLYYHIEKKEDLLYAVCVDSLTRIRREVEGAVTAHADPVARLRALIETHLVVGLTDEHKHATMLLELRALSPARRAEVVRLRDDYERLVRDVLAAAQASGAIRRDVPVKYLGLALLSLLNWTIVWCRPDGELSPVQLASLFVKMYLEGAGGQEDASDAVEATAG
jgi:TetR/AcrR family transcriptional regulator, cholesterol catabolism regulator